jgi:hypothetical protein
MFELVLSNLVQMHNCVAGTSNPSAPASVGSQIHAADALAVNLMLIGRDTSIEGLFEAALPFKRCVKALDKGGGWRQLLPLKRQGQTVTQVPAPRALAPCMSIRVWFSSRFVIDP